MIWCSQFTRDFGFENVRIKLSTGQKWIAGEDATWDRAEAALILALIQQGSYYTIFEGARVRFMGQSLNLCFVMRLVVIGNVELASGF